jgi:hypothetical protein
MAISREDISLLHNHDESLSEEQLRREIEHLNAELGKFKVREYRRSISPVPMPVHQETRRSTDSGGSGRRTVQSNALIFETSRYKTPTTFDTSTPYLGERQTTSELGSGVYKTHKQTSPSDKFVTTTRSSYKPLADISSKVTGTIEWRHDGHEHVESRKNKNIVKPATYDGKGPWLDYKSHFDACSEINHWSDKEKRLVPGCVP